MFVVFLFLNSNRAAPGNLASDWNVCQAKKRIGHDGYEFDGEEIMGTWCPPMVPGGIPWYFYHLFILVKLPVLTVAAFLAGFPLPFRRKWAMGAHSLLFYGCFCG